MKSNQKRRREPLFRASVPDDGSGDQSTGTPIPSEATWRNWFESAAKHPYTWKLQSEVLIRSANALFKVAQADLQHSGDGIVTSAEPPVTGVYLMLAGLALEILMKGILVMRKQNLDAESLMSKVKSHDLNYLARELGLKLDVQDSFLLARTSAHITWAGKYPTPLSFDEFVPRDFPDGGWGPISFVAMSDSERIKSLYMRFESMFESEFESMKRPVDNRSGT